MNETDLLERLKTSLADRYAIEREVGSGGMAVVFLANDLKHGRKVALKVLRPELAHAIGTDRFLSEIQITARLQCVNDLAHLLVNHGNVGIIVRPLASRLFARWFRQMNHTICIFA